MFYYVECNLGASVNMSSKEADMSQGDDHINRHKA